MNREKEEMTAKLPLSPPGEADYPVGLPSAGWLAGKLDLADGGRTEVSAGPASERGAGRLDLPGQKPLRHRRPQHPPRGKGGRSSSPVAGGKTCPNLPSSPFL